MIIFFQLFLAIFPLLTQASSTLKIQEVDSYGNFTCAILRDSDVIGAVKCWGDNTSGNLGIGFTDKRGDGANEMGNYLPAVNLGKDNFAKRIAVGYAHACALLDDDSVKCWGDNSLGQLGQGNTDDIGDSYADLQDEIPDVSLNGDVSAIYAGKNHTCAVMDNDDIKCWGANGSGQLGQGDTNHRGDQANEMGANLTAVDLGNGVAGISALSLGDEHTCVRFVDGDIKCWGGNAFGQLGQEHTNNLGDGPNEMGNNLNPIDFGANYVSESLAAGGYHNCATVSDDVNMVIELKCWGKNTSGQLGLGDTNHRGDGANEMGNNLTAVDLGANVEPYNADLGANHTCVGTLDNKIYCWGENSDGQLGVGHTNDIGDGANEMGNNLDEVELDFTFMGFVYLGANHSCAHAGSTDPDISCWGDNAKGQLGLGDTNDRGDGANEMGTNLPKIELGTFFVGVDSIADGHSDSRCMILEDDLEDKYVKCWGGNVGPNPAVAQPGQNGIGHGYPIGDHAHEIGHYLPAINLGTGRSPKVVGVGRHFACAILDNDKVKCWGMNEYGQLGQENTDSKGFAVGELGDSLNYIDLGTNRTAKALGVGKQHACVIMDNDKVKCWGRNSHGELGQEDKLHVGDHLHEMGDDLDPIDLGTNRTAKQIAVSGRATCVILDNDKVKCWGENFFGALGQGHTNNLGDEKDEMGDDLDPVELGTNRTATEIAAGTEHFCVFLDNGDMKCWGFNNVGQLGQGDSNNRGDGANEMGDDLDPVDIWISTPTAMALGREHTCILDTFDKVICWGRNHKGQLGLEGTNHVGDAALEMGPFLDEADLPFTPEKIFAVEHSTYAIESEVYGWGSGHKGALYRADGSTDDIGDQANEMGEDLQPFDLNVGLPEF